jgi:hypothetical protein
MKNAIKQVNILKKANPDKTVKGKELFLTERKKFIQMPQPVNETNKRDMTRSSIIIKMYKNLAQIYDKIGNISAL